MTLRGSAAWKQVGSIAQVSFMIQSIVGYWALQLPRPISDSVN